MTMVDGIGSYGGAESTARDIAQNLNPARFDVSFCATRWEAHPEFDQAREALRQAGVSFIGLKRRGRLDLGAWRPLVAHLRAHPVDILHTHKIGSNAWGALVAPLAGVPALVAHEHTWSYEGSPTRVALDRWLIARRAAAFVAVSAEDQRRMVEVERIPAAKTRLIESGIPDPPPPQRGREEMREELGLGADQPAVGVVATLRSQKALWVMVEAAAILRRSLPDLAVLVIGGENDRDPGVGEELRALAASLGVDGAVRFLGKRSDIPDLLGAIDVGSLSSDYEGCPLSVMEYMDARLPVVATRVGGVPSIVEDGVTGLLVPRRDPAALAEGLRTVLTDPALAERMGEAGRLRRRARFDVATMVGKVEALYEEVSSS